MSTFKRMLLEEKILPMAADAHADPFLGVWHSKDFLNRLAHKSQMLTKAFTSVSNVDADMHFFTMSLKEWTVFVNKLNIVGDGFAQRSIKDTFCFWFCSSSASNRRASGWRCAM